MILDVLFPRVDEEQQQKNEKASLKYNNDSKEYEFASTNDQGQSVCSICLENLGTWRCVRCRIWDRLPCVQEPEPLQS